MRLFRPLQPPVLEHECLDSSYRYREYLPSRPLDSYVACYWTVEFDASHTNQLHRIVPDGCVDIIFDLKSSSLSQGAFATGLMTEYEVYNLTQDCSLFGIRFFLDTAHHFFKYPVSEMAGNQVFLEDLWGYEAAIIVEEILSAPQTADIIAAVEARLLQFLPSTEFDTDSLLYKGMQYMVSGQGMISIRSLSEKLSYSERHIRRTFQNELGVSPKELLSILRFQFLLKELYLHPQTPFADAAIKFGYYDQSHFIKNFKHLYGAAPSEIFKSIPSSDNET